MMAFPVRRTQIQLTEEQARRLKKLAAAEGRSMADLIREGVEVYLASRGELDRGELVERALAAVGKFRSDEGDLSQRHDHYFAEAGGWKSS